MRIVLVLLSLLLLAPLQWAQSSSTEPGLTVRMFQLEVADLQEIPRLIPNQTPNRDQRRDVLDLKQADFEGIPAPMMTRALGWLVLKEAGEYVFRLRSDDGSRLKLDEKLVINHDGRHGATAKDSAPVGLTAGKHLLVVEHFDSGGGRSLRLEWRRSTDETFVLIPREALLTEADPTRVTSPGPKAVIDLRRPGRGLPVTGVHPSWRVETLRPEGFKPKVGAMCFLADGRLAFGTFDPLQRDERKLPDIESKAPDTIWALDPQSRELTKIASDVFEPSGMCLVDGDLYVAHRRAIDRLKDRDGDGFFETHETVAAGWEGWNYHQFVFGLTHVDGYLYATLSTTMAPPGWEGMETNSGPGGPMRGGVLEVDLSSNEARVIAGGTRTPNGIGAARDGTLVYLDNQGTWMPTSALCEVVPGAFYGHYNWTRFVPKLKERFPQGGHPSIFSDRERMMPALWLPQNEVVNSPTEPLPFFSPQDPSTGLDVYPGQQMLIGELTAGGVRRVCLERVEGVLQGALFRFSQGIEAGVNRMRWGPDGSLYLGCMGAGGNWNWKGTQFGLQRLVPTGKATFEMAAVRARPEGFSVLLTQPMRLYSLANLTVESWTYRPTKAYGGPKIDRREHRLSGYALSIDGRRLRLDVEGLEAGRCYHIAFDGVSKSGESIWSGETWYTLNRIPTRANEGGGHRDLAGATPLMPRGFPVQIRPKGRAQPKANLSQVDLMKHPGYFSLKRGDAPLISNNVFDDAVVELEWWCSNDLAECQVALNGVLYTLRAELPAAWEVSTGARPTGAGVWQTLRLHPRLEEAYWNGCSVPGIGFSMNEDENTKRLVIRPGEEDGEVRIRNVRVQAATGRYWGRPQGPWRDLLADPERWTALGGKAEFRIADGVLTGETRPNTPNTYLTSRDRFGDFELLYEFKVHPELNSGVQIRSEVLGSLDKRDSRLSGYQVEIDPSERSWTGGIFEEHGRGWLHPLQAAPYARRAFRQGAWNRVRVLAQGKRVRTWLNGVPVADLLDARHAEGHFGFQVHGVGGRKDPLTVQWRKLRLREL